MAGDTRGDLRVIPAGELTGSQLRQVSRIYDDGFPPELQVPFADLETGGPADLLLAAVDHDAPVAFASLLRLASDWTFLRYYAVAADRRRHGVGLRFWRVLRSTLAAAGWPARIVFEVEDPQHAPDQEERRVRAGRIAFWERCGARLLDVAGYVMPDLAGLASPEPMLLMAVTGAGEPALRAGQVADLVTVLYSGRYGLDSSHPMVTAAVASISG